MGMTARSKFLQVRGTTAIAIGLVQIFAVSVMGTATAAGVQPERLGPLASQLAAANLATAGPGRFVEFPADTPDDQLPIGVSWGNPAMGGLGGTSGTGNNGKIDEPDQVEGQELFDKSEVSRIDIGYTVGCSLAGAKIYCWGNNDYGQSGRPGMGWYYYPVPVTWQFSAVPTAISVGGRHACAVAAYQVYCWGDNTYGQLGVPDAAAMTDIPTAVDTSGVLKNKKVSAVSAGYWHTCVLAEGEVYCWGWNSTSQLGDGSKTNRTQPVAVSHGAWDALPVTSISAGLNQTCAIVVGKAYCWGANPSGQLGIGNNNASVPQPTAVSTAGVLKNLTVTGISAGAHVTCATAAKGSLRNAYCWGFGGDHSLGTGQAADSNIPVAVAVPNDVKDRVNSISADKAGGCLASQGDGYCWGAGSSGRIGDNGISLTPKPAKVSKGATSAAKDRIFLQINTQPYWSAGIAVSPRQFSDVGVNHTFYHDISWTAGAGITQGNADNTYQPTSSISRQAMAAFLFRYLNPGAPTPHCEGSQRVFTDVPKGAQFCGPVEWLAQAGIVAAVGDKKFHPTEPIDRAVMSVWLYRAHHPGLADLTCAPGPRMYLDVSTNHGNCGTIEWLGSVGVAGGYADSTYKPTEPVSRQAMAAFLHRLQNLSGA